MSCTDATITARNLKATITAVTTAATISGRNLKTAITAATTAAVLTASSLNAGIECAPQSRIHADTLLLEDGYHFLLEDGSNLIL